MSSSASARKNGTVSSGYLDLPFLRRVLSRTEISERIPATQRGDVASSALLFRYMLSISPVGCRPRPPFGSAVAPPLLSGTLETSRDRIHNFSVRVRTMHRAEGVAVCGADTASRATAFASFCMNFSSIPNGIDILFLAIPPQYPTRSEYAEFCLGIVLIV